MKTIYLNCIKKKKVSDRHNTKIVRKIFRLEWGSNLWSSTCMTSTQVEGQRFDPHTSRKIFLTISVSRDENVPPFIKNGTAQAGSDWKLSPVGLTHHRSTISRPKRVPKRDGLLDITPFCVMPIAYLNCITRGN
jgi:hypothetical protein